MQTHQKQILKTLIAVAIIAAAYYIFVRLTGLGVPCLFHLVTGFNCPGCGISRMLLALASLKITEAFAANAFLLVTLPLIIAEIIFYIVRKWRGLKLPRWNHVALIIYAALLIIWGVVRNIIGV